MSMGEAMGCKSELDELPHHQWCRRGPPCTSPAQTAAPAPSFQPRCCPRRSLFAKLPSLHPSFFRLPACRARQADAVQTPTGGRPARQDRPESCPLETRPRTFDPVSRCSGSDALEEAALRGGRADGVKKRSRADGWNFVPRWRLDSACARLSLASAVLIHSRKL